MLVIIRLISYCYLVLSSFQSNFAPTISFDFCNKSKYYSIDQSQATYDTTKTQGTKSLFSSYPK